MSRKGFWLGLVAGLIIMGLIAGAVGVGVFGFIRYRVAGLPQIGRSLRPDLPERPFGFGMRGRSFGFGFGHRTLGLGAFLCLPALLFIGGGLVLAAMAFSRARWHHRDSSPWCRGWVQPSAAADEHAPGGEEPKD
jgi:hypothetical protein